jgi:hypothetical protein
LFELAVISLSQGISLVDEFVIGFCGQLRIIFPNLLF